MSLSMDLSPVAETAVDTTHHILSPVVASVVVDFDKTVLLQMVLFSLLILVLKPLLLDPMLRVFSLREERTDGAKAEARAMQERAAEILCNYEKEVAKVRSQATEQRDELRRETAALEASIIEDASAAAAKIAAEGRSKIQGELASLESDLQKLGGTLANNIGSRILGRNLV